MKIDEWYGEIPDTWQVMTVEELVKNNILFAPKDGNHGNIHPKSSDFVENGIPFIMASDLGDGEIDYQGCKKITRDLAKTLQKGFAINNDVLLSHKATIGRTAIVKTHHDFIVLTPQVTYYRIKDTQKISSLFLYYLFSFSGFQKIIRLFSGGGSTRDYVGITAQLGLPILYPPYKEQVFIANTIDKLSKKIDNLRRQNETLEKIAQTLFKHWFIDFEFPNDDGKPYKSSGGAMVASELGDIPEGWRVESLEQEIKIQKGLSYKGAGLSDEKSGIPMHNLKSVYEGGGYQHEGIKFYNSDYKKHHICYARDLIVPNTEQGEKHKLIGFPARIPSYFKDVSILTHHLFLIRPLNTSYLTNEYIYYLLYSHLLRKQILGYTNGTTVNMLSPDGLKKPIFPKPPQELISNFSQVIKPVWDKFENNIQQIQTLTKTRDTLLPKLMSGQIRIKEVESLIEKVK